jgi:hypothetical protein
MKVIEKGKDRTAEVHIHVEGKVDALGEWGEYIDATDKAICCYVPVEEGHKVKIGGKFTGTVSFLEALQFIQIHTDLPDPGCCIRCNCRRRPPQSLILCRKDCASTKEQED